MCTIKGVVLSHQEGIVNAERKGTGSEAKLREAVPSTGMMVLPSSPHTTPAVRAMAASPAVPTGMPASGEGWREHIPL